MSKKQIGKILHQSQASKNLIVTLEEQTSIGDYVYNSKDVRIGEIFDIIGPVNSPLASIRLDKIDETTSSGQPVFIQERRKSRGKRGKRRRL